MRIIICVKRVAVLSDDVAFTDDGLAVDPDYLDFTLNEWDACAVDEAIRIRDAVGEGEVVVVTAGDPDADGELRRCLAMGADRAVRVWTEALRQPDPLTVAHALAEVIRPEEPDLVLCGVQSSDALQGATGAALAGFLDLPVVAVVTMIAYDATTRTATVHRELEGGMIDVVETTTPAVLTIQTGINRPRYVTFRAIQEAQGRDVAVQVAEPFGRRAYGIRGMSMPTRRRAEMIGGNPTEIAARILQIVRGSSAA